MPAGSNGRRADPAQYRKLGALQLLDARSTLCGLPYLRFGARVLSRRVWHRRSALRLRLLSGTSVGGGSDAEDDRPTSGMDLGGDSAAGNREGLRAHHRLADVGSGTPNRGRPEWHLDRPMRHLAFLLAAGLLLRHSGHRQEFARLNRSAGGPEVGVVLKATPESPCLTLPAELKTRSPRHPKVHPGFRLFR